MNEKKDKMLSLWCGFNLTSLGSGFGEPYSKVDTVQKRMDVYLAETKEKTVPDPTKLKLLTLEDYKQDIRARWLILQREVNELIIDIKKFIDFATPIVKNTFDKLKSLFSKKKST